MSDVCQHGVNFYKERCYICRPELPDGATQAALDKMQRLLVLKELIRSGYAAVNDKGQVVDIREHPNCIPIPPHKPQPPTSSSREE